MLKLRIAFVATAFALGVVTTSPVQAVNFQKNVVLTGSSPTYNAVGSSNAMPYEAFTFTVDMSGSYNLALNTSGGFYPNLGLYSASFNPSAPSTNLLNSVQHAPNNFAVSFTTTLTAGTTYVAALAGDLAFAAGGTNPPQYIGLFYIGGPGTVTQGAAAAVPEAASWAMLVVGFGIVGGTVRARRKSGLAFA